MSYNPKEIIDIAVGIEVAGYEFYTHCADKFKDAAISDVFDFLAREELEHKKLFQSLNNADKPEGVFSEEYFSYLKAIGGGRIFEKQAMTIDQIIAGIAVPEDAVRHAFGAEKESILFYSEMKPLYVNDPHTTSLLNRIIEEERKHVATLLDLLAKIRLTS
jgi:rubrerythrin